MTTPTPASNMHIASVNYAVTFGQLASAANPIAFWAAATHYVFTFDTGTTQNEDGSFTVAYSSSWWSQSAAEAAIAASLDGVCQDIATMLGLTLAQVQAAVTVARVWTYNENSYSIIPGVTTGAQQSTWADSMTYPAAAPPPAPSASPSGTG